MVDGVLFGAQVKQAGGFLAALKRAETIGAEAMQVFAQSPRQWKRTIGRSFEELGAIIERAGGDRRLGVCLDTQHLWASGHPAVQGLPAILEIPGLAGDGPAAEDLAGARRLHRQGLARRA
jgi:endonuclease IV